MFLIVAFLEIYGTAVGAWSWAAQMPVTGVPAGNPPSGIASIYVLFDIAAIALAPRLLAALEDDPAALARSDPSGQGGRLSPQKPDQPRGGSEWIGDRCAGGQRDGRAQLPALEGKQQGAGGTRAESSCPAESSARPSSGCAGRISIVSVSWSPIGHNSFSSPIGSAEPRWQC